MGIPSSRLQSPLFQATPSLGMGQQFGGNPFQMPQGQQPTPFGDMFSAPQAVARLSQPEIEALRATMFGNLQQRFESVGRGPQMPFPRFL
jgi:hypothetical protein